MRRFLMVATLLSVVSSQPPASGPPAIQKQSTDDSSPLPMTADELSELNDPLFLLVLKTHPQEIRLDEIEKLILGQSGRRSLFVVDERLQTPAHGEPRRAVLTYTGTTAGSRLDPNIALSMLFNDSGVTAGFLEAWGWDNGRSRYNYYKIDGNPAAWKFRGSSAGAEQLDPSQRRATCFACHVNGGPVMKELPLPWNNWHSFKNLVPYLSPAAPDHWKLAESPRFRDLSGAEDFETRFVLPSIRQFNGRRLSASFRPAASGEQEVGDGPRLLRPLFRTTEYNITSAGQLSGLHPIPKIGTGPPEKVAVPDTFFLNANLLAGGGIQQYGGIGIPEARQFGSVLTLAPAEYQRLVTQSKTLLGGLAGDSNFAWFVPEPSHIDNQMIDLLIRRGVITREFAAAALAVDLENPVFSGARAGLLAVIPAQFRFRLLADGEVPAAHPDPLTLDVIARLQALNPAAGTAEAEFLTMLENANPVAALRGKIAAYLQRLEASLASPQQRIAELDRLYGLVLQRRKDAIAQNPALIESKFLFPIGTP